MRKTFIYHHEAKNRSRSDMRMPHRHFLQAQFHCRKLKLVSSRKVIEAAGKFKFDCSEKNKQTNKNYNPSGGYSK